MQQLPPSFIADAARTPTAATPSGALSPTNASATAAHTQQPTPKPSSPAAVSGPHPREHQTPTAEDNGPKQLIVNYIPSNVSEEELRQIFAEFGTIDAVRIIVDRATGRPKGYGFVYYRNSADAALVIQRMNGFELYGKWLKVGYANPQRPMPPP